MADETTPATAAVAEQGNALDNAAEHYKWAATIGSTREELARLGATQGPSEVAADSPAVITPAAGGSAWNNGGTWEDKDITAKATGALKTSLKAFTKDVSVGGVAATLTFAKVPRCEGTVTVIYSRGKAKPGYDLKLTATWQIDSKADGTVLGKGKLMMEEGDETDLGEHEFTVSAGEGSSASGCTGVVKAAFEEVNEVFSAWFVSLKTM